MFRCLKGAELEKLVVKVQFTDFKARRDRYARVISAQAGERHPTISTSSLSLQAEL